MRNSLLSHNFNRFLIIQLCSAATDGCQAGRHVCVCVRVCIMQLMQLIFCAAALFCLICNRFVEVSSQSDCVLCKHQNVIKTNRSGFLISFSFLVSPAWLLLCRLFFFCEIRKSSARWMSFHFHYVCIHDLVHGLCIHAVSSRVLALRDSRSSTVYDDIESV